MTRARVAGGLVGAVFGATLSWTGLTSPEVIRQGLLFEDSYLYLVFIAGLITSFAGLRLLRALRLRAVLTGTPIHWEAIKPKREHLVGSVIFGVGWGVADACPGPVATQLGQGIWWSLFTLAGIAAGITLFLRRQPQPAPDFVRTSKAKAPEVAVRPSSP
jgi:uncharacterized membrane protein YedE/YeeE